MQQKNMIKNPLIIVTYTIIILFVISFLPQDLTVFGVELRHVDIFSDLKYNEDLDNEYYEDYKDDEDFEEEVVDSSENEGASIINFKEKNIASFPALSKVAEYSENFIADETAKINDYMTSSKITTKAQKLTGDIKQLDKFFNALKQTKSKKIRIAHFGDSAIEGDLVTADLRENFQQRFGGNGVGFLSITSQDIQFRQTTKHSFSDTWKSAALYATNPERLTLGISGEVFIPNLDNSWFQYETTRRYRYLSDFSLVRLLYSNAKSPKINYTFDRDASKTAMLELGSGVKELTLTKDSGAKKIKIEIPKKDQADFYGALLENGNGIYIDNYPLRGNTGVDLKHLSTDVLKQFNELLNYKLIILEFGLNAAGSVRSNYSSYIREMTHVIKNLKEAFPNASFLMISVHDKSMKRGSQFVTDPAILKLLKAQIKIAKDNKIAIWNLFEAMGGRNSMPKWVDSNPPLAFRDYTHFNDQGAKKVADLLSEAIFEAYDKF